FSRRADALFELGDALLCAQAVPSLPHLSLEPVHRRGWGSAYAALARGRIDIERLRDLLASSPPPTRPPGFAGVLTHRPRCRTALARLRALLARSLPPPGPLVFAVDVTTWPRCDAECSPERGYYYHPSRHSAGQPIINGWARPVITQLTFRPA